MVVPFPLSLFSLPSAIGLTSVILIYRVAWSLAPHTYCPCLGTLPKALGMSDPLVNGVATSFLGAAILSLLWLLLRGTVKGGTKAWFAPQSTSVSTS